MSSTNLRFIAKPFKALTLDELYAILSLRAEVFVVEQDCPYQDVDGVDPDAFHALGWHNQTLMAYARWYPKGDAIALGRIVSRGAVRGQGAGRAVVGFALDQIGNQRVVMSAQSHLERFYGGFGFQTIGPGYLEDGIPHLPMARDPRD